MNSRDAHDKQVFIPVDGYAAMFQDAPPPTAEDLHGSPTRERGERQGAGRDGKAFETGRRRRARRSGRRVVNS